MDKGRRGRTMKRHQNYFLLFLIVFGIFFGVAPVQAAKLSALSVKGTQLVNEKGKPVQLKGVSTHGLSWFPQYVNQKAFTNIKKNWNANAVRLALYTSEYNGYCTGDAANQKALEERIDKGIQYATNAGLYVILDWHILSDGNPRTYEKQAVILIGTPNWSQDVDVVAKSPIKGYQNLMYTLHFYAGTHGADLRKKAKTALAQKLPLFVSEFGISEASGNGTLNQKEGKQWMKFLKNNKISYIGWNLSNKEESSALLKSFCTKMSAWKNTDLSPWGKWLVKQF